MNDLLLDLNKEQKEAVIFGDGPLLIVAGAGTGKTTVLTRRIAYLISKGIKPEEILAVTFTEKAAKEMEDRVEALLPFDYYDFWISTFHSFCDRVLKRYGLLIGIPTNYKLLDDSGSWMLVKRNFHRFNFLKEYKPLGNPTKFIQALVHHFSQCKNEGIYPEDYLKYVDGLDDDNEEKERIREVAMAYEVYQQLLLDNNVLDFGDLINYALQIFDKKFDVLEKYRNQFKYIMVDEFQDTNWVQYELIQKLAYPKNNITIVGDDDQSIYSFSGSSFNNVLRFKKDYPNSKEIVLVENYRSPQNILDLSYCFIQNNNPNRLECQLEECKSIVEDAEKKGINVNNVGNISKKLKSNKRDDGIIELLSFEGIDEEITGVINKIWEVKEIDSEATFSNFAILTRTNDHANTFSRALERAGLPYQFFSSKGLYKEPLIIDLISYLKVILNFYDSLNFYRVLRMMNFSPEEVSRITQYSDKKGIPIFESLKDNHLLGKFTVETKTKINKLVNNLNRHYELSKIKNVGEVFVSVIQDLEYGKYIPEDTEDGFRKWELIDQFYEKVKEFENSQTDAKLCSFIDNLQMELDAGEEGPIRKKIESQFDAIKIMTVHSSKGLEFDYVFLPYLVARSFPSDQKRDPIEIPKDLVKEVLPGGDFHIQEERRLFYVALTRAKQGLFLTWSTDHGGKQLKKPSRFLSESNLINEEIIKNQNFVKSPGFCIKKSMNFKLESDETNGSGKDLKMFMPDHFSYSQLESFRKCPLEYKLKNILKVKVRGKSVFSFGKTIHSTLYRFVQKALKEKTTLREIFKIYDEEWIFDWYQSEKEREEFYNKGKESLKLFYDNFKKDKDVLFIDGVEALEKGFQIKLNGDVIIGMIDRIDKAKGGVEIIDYKTGSPKKSLVKDDKLQLLIYALAAKRVLGLNPVKLTYYYLDDCSKLSFEIKDGMIEKTESEIRDLIQKIKRSNFKPSPGWHCKFCDFRDICAHKKV
ncbi:MAG: UvrD-helicase domain-containing protein [Candidatus Paceibacterota bacterium]|jgi:DNA helicase-2/ATP-dependent DNA helicase PcrA